jgi:hypothetical protein
LVLFIYSAHSTVKALWVGPFYYKYMLSIMVNAVGKENVMKYFLKTWVFHFIFSARDGTQGLEHARQAHWVKPQLSHELLQILE